VRDRRRRSRTTWLFNPKKTTEDPTHRLRLTAPTAYKICLFTQQRKNSDRSILPRTKAQRIAKEIEVAFPLAKTLQNSSEYTEPADQEDKIKYDLAFLKVVLPVAGLGKMVYLRSNSKYDHQNPD